MDTKRFNELRSMYPEWSDEKIWTTISIERSSTEAIEAGGTNVSVTPEFVRTIVNAAGEWLKRELPNIYNKVADFFIVILDEIKRWVKENLPDLLEQLWIYITNYFS